MRTLLISAYACEPLKGSEQGVGWNWVLQMARHNKLHVITRSNNQESIEAHLPENLAKNITFHYYDTHPIIKGLKNKAKGLYSYYFCWQLGIISLIKKLSKQHTFDYSMHLTMGSIWMPTFLPLLNTPFIWGPIGGGEGIPKPFLSMLPAKSRFVQTLRYFLQYTAYINPFVFIPSYKAISIITRTNNTKSFIPSLFKNKVKVYLETSMEPSVFNFQKDISIKNNKINLIITGRLVPFKNVISVVKALKYIESEYNYQLTIIGSGSEEKKIKNELVLLNLSNKVKFIKETTRNKVLTELSKSDIYLFPSLREGGSWALMEAMAIGLPVICLNWSGVEVITDDASAVRLPVTNPQQMPKDLASAICKLIDNPTLRKEMGMHGRERIKNVFNWEAKGRFMENLLNELDSKKETC
ncbi:MAG: glycosyltransferase involved in cell wall biosynthesis [Flavobacteriaceae bacterium]|jgi:glycosyltransferase involved in cell wall biosynthesis